MSREYSPLYRIVLGIASMGLIVGGLYLARDLLVPLVLAGLLGFLLLPIVDRLERLRVPRVPAAVLATAVAVATVAGLASIVAWQAFSIARTLPQYRDNIHAKLDAISGSGEGPTKALADLFDRTGRPDTQSAEAASQGPEPASEGEAPPEKPVPVTVVDAQPTASALARDWAGTLLRPLALLGLVMVLVVFLLIQWEDIRDRVLRLISSGHITVTTRALDDFTTRVARYLRVQLAVNVGCGLLSALALWAVGMPNAFLWGVLGATLRFVPYLGPIVAMGLPVALALAISNDWWLPLKVFLIFLIIESISNNFVEPFLYAGRTGVSTFALIFAAVFWTWLWGWQGLLLSTPMTVGLAVLGRYVPQLEFLAILLGDSEPLPPEERLYQRLAAMDQDEASDIAAAFAKGEIKGGAPRPLAEVFDALLVPALRVAEQERESGALAEDRLAFVHGSMRELVDEAVARARAASPVSPAPPGAPRVLCIPASDEADYLAGSMLVESLVQAGVAARVLSLDDLGSDVQAIVADYKPTVLCISAIPPYATGQARIRCKQLLHRLGPMPVVVGLWGYRGDSSKAEARLKDAGATFLITSIAVATSRATEAGGARANAEAVRVATADRGGADAQGRMAAPAA